MTVFKSVPLFCQPALETVRGYADDTIHLMRKIYNVDFSDYHVSRLEDIDRVLNEWKAGGADVNQLGKSMYCIGSYAGEVLRNITPGEWFKPYELNTSDDFFDVTAFPELMAEYPFLAVKLPDGRVWKPINLAFCFMIHDDPVNFRGDLDTFLVLGHPQTVFQAGERLAARLSRIDGNIRYPDTMGGCFIKGMRVQTKEGFKPIGDIQVGDWVLSSPEDGLGTPEYKRVVKTFAHEPQRIFNIFIYPEADADFAYSVMCTGNHPFWVEGIGWTRADTLRAGQCLRRGDGGHAFVGGLRPVYRTGYEGIGWIPVTRRDLAERGSVFDYANYAPVDKSIEEELRYLPEEVRESDDPFLHVPVYNIEVEDYRTYYMGGRPGFWVHSANCV